MIVGNLNVDAAGIAANQLGMANTKQSNFAIFRSEFFEVFNDPHYSYDTKVGIICGKIKTPDAAYTTQFISWLNLVIATEVKQLPPESLLRAHDLFKLAADVSADMQRHGRLDGVTIPLLQTTKEFAPLWKKAERAALLSRIIKPLMSEATTIIEDSDATNSEKVGSLITLLKKAAKQDVLGSLSIKISDQLFTRDEKALEALFKTRFSKVFGPEAIKLPTETHTNDNRPPARISAPVAVGAWKNGGARLWVATARGKVAAFL
jgi:hypothetical protein